MLGALSALQTEELMWREAMWHLPLQSASPGGNKELSVASGGQEMVPWAGGLLPQAGRDLGATLSPMDLRNSAQNSSAIIPGKGRACWGWDNQPQPEIPSDNPMGVLLAPAGSPIPVGLEEPQEFTRRLVSIPMDGS